MTASAFRRKRRNTRPFLRSASDFGKPASEGMHGFLHGFTAMRPSKNFSYSLAALLLSSCLCGPWAHAANASFGVQVRVVRHDVPLAPVDVPVPPDARKMTSSAAGESYVFSGKSSTAAEFFHRAMAERGYREIPAGKDDAVLTWERDGHRVRIRIDAVLGSKDTSRIMVDNADA